MSEPLAARGLRAIQSFHAHIYFRDAQEREHALRLRDWMAERFALQLGRVHDEPIGPHSVAMYQVAFARELFASFVPWLMLNRLPLSVLVHPNTGHGRDDHSRNALWLGEPLAVKLDFLSNDPEDDPISPIENNTAPTVSGE
jgi:aromatic ring-cleaving dioxygenase